MRLSCGEAPTRWRRGVYRPAAIAETVKKTREPLVAAPRPSRPRDDCSETRQRCLLDEDLVAAPADLGQRGDDQQEDRRAQQDRRDRTREEHGGVAPPDQHAAAQLFLPHASEP